MGAATPPDPPPSANSLPLSINGVTSPTTPPSLTDPSHRHARSTPIDLRLPVDLPGLEHVTSASSVPPSLLPHAEDHLDKPPHSAPPALLQARSNRNTMHSRRLSGAAALTPSSHFSKPIEMPPEAAKARLEAEAVPANRATLERVQSGNIDLAQKLSGSTGAMTIKKHVAKFPRIGHGHRKKVKDGQVVFKGHKNWEIVLSIQFGLKFTSELLDDATDSEPTPEDYEESLAFDFNPNDDRSSIELNSFARWVHPAPYVYKLVRQRFGVEENDFLDSTCAESRVRELPTPGKSGALFYITDDEKYFMKTIQQVEERMLVSMLPSYYRHVASNPRTFLTKYMAHFSVQTRRDRHIRMVVMASIFNDKVFIDQKYDLKGSTFHRFASEEQLKSENVTLKDQDLKKPIFFRPEQLDQIMKQLDRDSAYLESHHVMDYSLLVGLSHMLSEEKPYFRAEFGELEESAPHYVGYQLDDQGRKSGIRVCMGIIDFLQRFRLRKRLEYSARILQSCSCTAASVAPPHLYKDRFMSFLREKFLPDPNLDVSTLESTVVCSTQLANENEDGSGSQDGSGSDKEKSDDNSKLVL
ncbi:unnamed protein product [Agarophyton chilense]